MRDWHLGMVETEDGRPRSLGPADAMTLLRVWLVPVAADRPTPLVCAVALATDGLDGALARGGERTRIGRDLEGLADTCFAVAALRGAARRRWLHRWVAAAELGRLGIGFGYTLWVYFGRTRAPDPRVVRAARLTTPVRAAGLVAAGLGRRRWGTRWCQPVRCGVCPRWSGQATDTGDEALVRQARRRATISPAMDESSKWPRRASRRRRAEMTRSMRPRGT